MEHKVGLNTISPQGLSQSLISHRAFYHHIMWKLLLFYEIFLIPNPTPIFCTHIFFGLSRNV